MKKLAKLHLRKVKSVTLSKDEMKKVVGSAGCNASSCGGPCSVTIGTLTYTGSCGWDISTDRMICACGVY